MLEGPPVSLTEPDLMVFPSLRDEDLERLGVAESSRLTSPSSSPASSLSGGMSDKDIESKFTALSLAFKTDKMTLGQRLQRQQRQRDQAESNMAAEFTRLLDIHKRLSRATSDAERGDFLDRFRSQLEALDHASRQVSSAAEMYGAVQQEDRLSHAMEVIDLYVESLKRLHQKLCQELEEKKRVLSENNIVLEELQDLTEEPPPRTTRYRSLSALATNPLAGTKRRASIAAMPRPGSLPANGDPPALSKSLGNGSSPVQDARSGRWSAPSRVRKVSLVTDQAPSEQQQQQQQQQQSPPPSLDRRDSRADAYVLSNSTSCMSEIAELSESRRESAAEQADDCVEEAGFVTNCCLMALAQNGGSTTLVEDEDPVEQQTNGVCRCPVDPVTDRMAALAGVWCRGREMAVELWWSVSKDSFRWLRLWIVCALVAASIGILINTLLPQQASLPLSK